MLLRERKDKTQMLQTGNRNPLSLPYSTRNTTSPCDLWLAPHFPSFSSKTTSHFWHATSPSLNTLSIQGPCNLTSTTRHSQLLNTSSVQRTSTAGEPLNWDGQGQSRQQALLQHPFSTVVTKDSRKASIFHVSHILGGKKPKPKTKQKTPNTQKPFPYSFPVCL